MKYIFYALCLICPLKAPLLVRCYLLVLSVAEAQSIFVDLLQIILGLVFDGKPMK